MKVEQISVFLENKAGRLAEVTRVLGEAGINIRALSLADTTDFGILRLIVDQYDKARQSYEDVLETKPDTLLAVNNLAVLLVDHFPGEESLARAERLVGALRDSQEPAFIDTMGRSFDVSSDGQRLYVIKQPSPPDGSRINVITNWRGQP